MCPGNEESAGKRRSGKTRQGSKWLRSALTESARAAARTKGTSLAAHYARLRGRRGSKKAAVAVGHSILVIFPVKVAHVHAVTLIARGLLIEPVPVAASLAAHKNFSPLFLPTS